MTLYILSASGGTGKTTTLNTLANNLVAQATKYTLGVGCVLPPTQPWASDGKYWFDTVGTGKTVRVGISTAGDSPKNIDEAVDYFVQNQCDVCFMACHMWGHTVNECERKAQTLGVVPQYLYLISSTSGRPQTAVQHDVATFMERLI